jgi:hypothetical protein
VATADSAFDNVAGTVKSLLPERSPFEPAPDRPRVSTEVRDRLKKLKEIYDEGLIGDDDYIREQQRILRDL